MTELTTDAGAAGSERSPISVIAVKDEAHLSVSEAARSLAQARKPKEQQQQAAEQRTDGAAQTAGQESTAPADDATSPETPGDPWRDRECRSGSAENDQALPPIEPPRSWTKEDKALFTGLPRETQEQIAERERSRESDFLRRQNEAADKLKGLTARSRRWTRQGSNTKPRCRSFSPCFRHSRPASSPTSRRWRTSSAWPARLAPLRPLGRAAEEDR